MPSCLTGPMSYRTVKAFHVSLLQSRVLALDSEIRTVCSPADVMTAGGGGIAKTRVLKKARLLASAGLQDIDADRRGMPAVRFADLKIKTRNTARFSKHFGETTSRNQQTPKEGQRQVKKAQNKGASDKPEEGSCDEGREFRHGVVNVLARVPNIRTVGRGRWDTRRRRCRI